MMKRRVKKIIIASKKQKYFHTLFRKMVIQKSLLGFSPSPNHNQIIDTVNRETLIPSKILVIKIQNLIFFLERFFIILNIGLS